MATIAEAVFEYPLATLEAVSLFVDPEFRYSSPILSLYSENANGECWIVGFNGVALLAVQVDSDDERLRPNLLSAPLHATIPTAILKTMGKRRHHRISVQWDDESGVRITQLTHPRYGTCPPSADAYLEWTKRFGVMRDPASFGNNGNWRDHLTPIDDGWPMKVLGLNIDLLAKFGQAFVKLGASKPLVAIKAHLGSRSISPTAVYRNDGPFLWYSVRGDLSGVSYIAALMPTTEALYVQDADYVARNYAVKAEMRKMEFSSTPTKPMPRRAFEFLEE